MENRQEIEGSQLTWDAAGQWLVRYRKVMLITLLAVVAGAYGTLLCMTDQYQSKASLLVKLGRENIELPTTVQATGSVTTGLRPEELNSEIQILKSRELMKGVVDRLGVSAFAFDPPAPHGFWKSVKYYRKRATRWVKARAQDALIGLNLEKRITPEENAILTLEGAVDAVPEKTSDVLTVTTRLPSAELALRVEQTLLQLYLERRSELRRNPAEGQFFTQEMQEHSAALADLEKQRNDLRSRYKLTAIAEQKDLLLKQRSDLQTQISSDMGSQATLVRQQSAMQSRLQRLDGQVRVSEVRTPNPAVQSYKERLSQLQVERAKMVSRYQENSEPVRKMDEEIASLQSLVKAEPSTLVGSMTEEPNPTRRQFVQNTEANEVAIAGLRAHVAQLHQPLDQVDSSLRSLDDGERKLEDVDRQLKLAQDSYMDVARRAQESQLHEQLDQSHMANISILANPSEPIEPVSPRRLVIMAVAIPLGLLLGAVLALLLHYMDDTVRSEDDVTRLGLRPLGVLTEQVTVGRREPVVVGAGV